jgi:hypothetical protein
MPQIWFQAAPRPLVSRRDENQAELNAFAGVPEFRTSTVNHGYVAGPTQTPRK